MPNIYPMIGSVCILNFNKLYRLFIHSEVSASPICSPQQPRFVLIYYFRQRVRNLLTLRDLQFSVRQSERTHAPHVIPITVLLSS